MIDPQRKPEKGKPSGRKSCEDCGLDFDNFAELTHHRETNHSQTNNEESRNRENVPVE
jgi:hypothetical protein